MSFSANTKAELCRVPLNRACCAVAEAYGVFLYAYQFSAMEIRVITGCAAFAKRLPKLMLRAFGLEPDSRSGGAKRSAGRKRSQSTCWRKRTRRLLCLRRRLRCRRFA